MHNKNIRICFLGKKYSFDTLNSDIILDTFKNCLHTLYINEMNKFILTHGKLTINGNTTRGNKRIPYFKYFPNPAELEVSLPKSAPS